MSRSGFACGPVSPFRMRPTCAVARAAALVSGALVLAMAGCETSPGGAPGAALLDAGPSPNASILPSPLATEVPDLDAGTGPDSGFAAARSEASGKTAGLDASAPPPEPLQPAEALAPEAPGARDLPGVILEGAWKWRDVPAAPRAPEVSAEGIREAAKLTALTWRAHLADAGRLRIELTSRALPLPMRSEIRARADRWGHVVLWPNATEYRVAAPGALRTLLGERRVDVTPLSLASVRAQGEGRRLGVQVRKVEVSGGLGTLRLELGKVADAGEGGALLCRAFVEIAGVDPKSASCQAGEVPLHAAYAWSSGGFVSFDASALSKRVELPAGDMVVPPPGATLARAGLPAAPGGIFLTREELAAFRTTPLPLPPRDDPSVPGEGFVAVNRTEILAYLLVDGIPVVAVPPFENRYVIGTAKGRYTVQWRTFLGDRVGPVETVELPARLVNGTIPDAGAPDGG